MDVLNLFLDHPKLSLSDMAQLSGIPKTSVHRMIRSLEEMGFLHKDADGYYALGLMFLQFGHLVAERLDIRNIARPFMQKLRDEVDQAVHLVLRDGDEAIYIEKLDTQHPVRLYTKIGRKAPLYAGAASRIILAFLPDEQRKIYLENVELKPIASGTVTSMARLVELLEQSRRTGYSHSRSELENYTAELSAPIFDHSGQIIAALSIAGLELSFQGEKMPYLIRCVKQAAQDISRQLGCTKDAPVLSAPANSGRQG